MFIRWKSIEERLPLLFSVVFSGGIVACFCSGKRNSPPGSVVAVRAKGERGSMLLLIYVCHPRVLEFLHMLSNPRALLLSPTLKQIREKL